MNFKLSCGCELKTNDPEGSRKTKCRHGNYFIPHGEFIAIISNMGRKQIINVPAKRKEFKAGSKVKVKLENKKRRTKK